MLLAVLVPLLAACGSSSGGGTGPDDTTPVITVSGVSEGGSHAPPVTITIGVAPGSYTAKLNGTTIVSGHVVSQPGLYTLVVNARNGTATADTTIAFTVLAGGTGDVLIVRLLDLRGGTFGAPGDAILLTDSSAEGQFHALIDAGARDDVDSYVRSRLLALGVDTLVFLQLTHAHADHYAGMDEILNSAIHVEHFVYGQNRITTGGSFENVINAANANADQVTLMSSTIELELGGGDVPTLVTMIPPHPDYDGNIGNENDGETINEGSIGTHVSHGGFRMFFTGDGQDDANDRWRLQFAGLSGDVDILKVGHHAANDATQSSWLSHSSFEVAAVSANGTTHPRIGALDRVFDVSTEVYCTNVHGEIRITVDEAGSYTIGVEKNAGAPCAAGSEANT